MPTLRKSVLAVKLISCPLWLMLKITHFAEALIMEKGFCKIMEIDEAAFTNQYIDYTTHLYFAML
jgi:hypothetical protein